MTTLDDFGVERETEPRVYRKAWRRSAHTGKICGFIGREVKRGNGAMVYTTLKREGHRYRKEDAYPISDAILQDCADVGVSRIFVHTGTTPEDDVLEFRARDYFDGEFVPESDLHNDRSDGMRKRDPQRYVPASAAIHEWRNYAAALFVEAFEEACDRIGRRNRRY